MERGERGQVAWSTNGVPVRLTAERWMHIVEARDELAGRVPDILDTIEKPDWITKGYRGALVAWKNFGRANYLAVIYKETSARDGFVVTAFFTSKPKRRNKLWP